MNKERLAELFELPAKERLQIARDLWDSANPEVPPPTSAQIAKALRRLEEHRADPNSAIPWEEVRAALWACPK